ncbi:MAG: 4Fe-4S binding protein [Lachnospirales bacterium]
MSLLNKKDQRKELVFLDLSKIKYIEQDVYSPGVINFENLKIKACCLKCQKPKCLKIYTEELICSNINDFPYDRFDDVCQRNAISWDYNNECPVIDKSRCINCTMCAMRCPTGAIYYDGDSMQISLELSEIHNTITLDNCYAEKHQEMLNLVSKILVKRRFISFTDTMVKNIYTNIVAFIIKEKKQNYFVRNLLIQVGANSCTSRIGDVYTRMDGIYQLNGHRGPIEVEFGTDSLEASRGILDDVAVLQTRYNLKKEEQTPLVVCLSLPNKRQGYYQVIKDIKNVLNIEIRTITLGTLLLLAWNGRNLCFENSLYYIDFDNLSLINYIQLDLHKYCYLPENELGIFEPKK